jgi:hypothetical protein
MHYWSTIPILLLLALPAADLAAQDRQGGGSPYSAYGLGDPTGSPQVSQALMGGLGIGIIDPFSVIHANPASYVSLRIPVFEAGVVSRQIDQRSSTASVKGSRTDLLGLSIGVPIGKGTILDGNAQLANRWAFTLGINPISKVNYRINNTGIDPLTGEEVRFEYSGDGGLNSAYLGTALTVWQNNDTINKGAKLSIGANLDYVFGRTEEIRKAYYPGGSNYYNTYISDDLIVRSPMFSTGVQLTGDLKRRIASDSTSAEKRGWRYVAGASVELPADLATDRTRQTHSFVVGVAGVEFAYDTSFRQTFSNYSIHLPALIGAGFSIFNDRWLIGLEHRRRDWGSFSMNTGNDVARSNLATQGIYSLGGSYRPAGERAGIGLSIFERSTYRMGLRYMQDHRIVNGEQLQEFGIAFGIGLPIMAASSFSRINLGVELGERGTTDNGLIRERFANIMVGVTITPDPREQWFKKRRLE